MQPVVVSCAVTGGFHTPSVSPPLPVILEKITDSTVDAADAGASIIHLRALDTQTGKTDTYPENFIQYSPRIAEQTGTMVEGNMPVNPEDKLNISKGELATSNAHPGMRIRVIIETPAHTIAPSAQARAQLALKGASEVAFGR